MQATTFDQTARDRAVSHAVRVTYAHGQMLDATVQLSVADLETWRRDGEITPDAYCECCGQHVTECPAIGRLLLDWPERTYSTCWGPAGTAHELGLTLLG